MTRRNLAFVNAALSIANAERFVDGDLRTTGGNVPGCQMAGTPGTNEAHSLRGPIDRAALLTIRNVIEREEPLATPALDDYLNPTVLFEKERSEFLLNTKRLLILVTESHR